MEKLNREFFDEYTKLDGLCKMMLNSPKGISGYIESMYNVPLNKSRLVKEWDSDLKMLKQYRRIRNELAHSVGAFHREICVRYDITWIKQFQTRIKKKTDPLSLLFKASQQKQRSKKKKKAQRKQLLKRAFWILVAVAVITLIVLAVKG